ncbi:flavin monoamine oxidase family protein [Jeotgalibacillus haloalkalitolerans]|uniref:FAD-dependent oxidoreductase n=1 Tax=Jeotgalibacillus haloalkalitolerans TaxID=3104292 RepID=A0ABU5KNR9_9BACL|nr:FAD-dependent oxidoreductase [Jeotgalibacillus sp. HH7-29]MDZ5712802.1 FAD-dependent oxidoreductase [Jeotgalibacillus sp. HH7-29]
MNQPVLIVGAGLSGLYTASLLSDNGITCKVIESRDRIGGRVLSEEAAGSRFDLGPTWFWPEHEPAITALIKKLGLKTFTQHTKGELLFEQAADSPAQRHTLPAHAAERSERVEGGMQSLIEAVAKTLPAETVELNTTVTEIEMNQKNEVSVHAVNGDEEDVSYEAASVILALPPRLLKRISFSPELTGLSDLPTWMGGQAKIISIYDRPFWREKGLSGQAMSWIGPLQEIHDASPQKGPGALFGFFSLTAAQRLEIGEEKVKTLVKDQFERLYGREAGQPVALLYKDWATDTDTAADEDALPLTDFPQYQPQRPFDVKDPWHHTLFFAGTETSSGSGGHLEGAIRSAERVAASIIKLN